MSTKKINELENYDITKATEQDVIPVVETKDGVNETKKLPVSDLRDIMAKYNIATIATIIVSLIDAVRNATGSVLATAIERVYGVVSDFMEAWLNEEIDLNALIVDVLENVNDDMIEVFWNLSGQFDGGKESEMTSAEKREAMISYIQEAEADFVPSIIMSFMSRNREAVSNLENRVTALEEALNQGETPVEEAPVEETQDSDDILSQAQALNLELNGSDSNGMSLEEILSAIESKLGITPADGATVEERWAAIQANIG